MISIHYPCDIDNLKRTYLAIFPLGEMKCTWNRFEKKYNVSLEDLLVGDFKDLAHYYICYRNIINRRQYKNCEDLLYRLFDYDKYQPKIAAFFMNPNNGIKLHTCHYCNMSYINGYGHKDSYNDLLVLINNAEPREWRRLFDEKKLPKEKLNEIIEKRKKIPFCSLLEFNKEKYLHRRIETYSVVKNEIDANQFDLDHVLPKSKCPIISLSLFNFVPSCQVCNEKLKGEKELGETEEELCKLSPTLGRDYHFEDDVIIKLIPQSTCSTFFAYEKNIEKFRLDFEYDRINDASYEKSIEMFRLRDRYNFHKKEALRLMDLKERYPQTRIAEMSKLLSVTKDGRSNPSFYTEDQIEQDLFGKDFSSDRCFGKMYKDIIENN